MSDIQQEIYAELPGQGGRKEFTMSEIKDSCMISNRGLAAGDIVTEIRSHPFINRAKEGKGMWDFTDETVHFEITEVCRSGYQCRYTDTEDKQEFYWPFWDRQPNNGFWKNGCSAVRYFEQKLLGW